MLLTIQKKNYSTELTRLQYKKEYNAFVGTDSFIILEFIPNQVLGCDDFFVTYSQLEALKFLCGKDMMLTSRGQHDLNGKKLLEVTWSDWSIFLPMEEQTYPDYRQPQIRGTGQGEIKELHFAKTMERFIKIGQIIAWVGKSEVRNETFYFEHEDSLGTYRLSMRRFVEDDEDE